MKKLRIAFLQMVLTRSVDLSVLTAERRQKRSFRVMWGGRPWLGKTNFSRRSRFYSFIIFFCSAWRIMKFKRRHSPSCTGTFFSSSYATCVTQPKKGVQIKLRPTYLRAQLIICIGFISSRSNCRCFLSRYSPDQIFPYRHLISSGDFKNWASDFGRSWYFISDQACDDRACLRLHPKHFTKTVHTF